MRNHIHYPDFHPLSATAGQSSYAHSADAMLGLHVIDEFSLALGRMLRRDRAGELTLREAAAQLAGSVRLSTVTLESTDARTDSLLLRDFFG